MIIETASTVPNTLYLPSNFFGGKTHTHTHTQPIFNNIITAIFNISSQNSRQFLLTVHLYFDFETTDTVLFDHIVFDSLPGQVETDKIVFDSLPGQVETDKIVLDSLPGQVETDKIVFDSLSGQVETDQIVFDSLPGQVETNTIVSDSLPGQVETDKTVFDSLPGQVETDTTVFDSLPGQVEMGNNVFWTPTWAGREVQCTHRHSGYYEQGPWCIFPAGSKHHG